MSSEETEYVYLIGNEGSPIVKIGRSVDVPGRLSAIQFMSPLKLAVLWQTEGGSELEAELHRYFKAQRSHGEWFDFTGLDAVEVVQDVIARGLHKRMPRTRASRPNTATPINEGDRVGIISDRWEGPLYGAVRKLETNRSGDTIYRVGGPGEAQTEWYAFSRSELQLLQDLPGDEELARRWEFFTHEMQWRLEHC